MPAFMLTCANLGVEETDSLFSCTFFLIIRVSTPENRGLATLVMKEILKNVILFSRVSCEIRIS